MAGHNGPLKTDPAIEYYNKWIMTHNLRFKPSYKNMPSILMLTMVVPGLTLYLAYQSQGYMESKPQRRTERIHEREYKLP